MNTALLLMSKLAAMLTMVAVGWLAVRFRVIQGRDSAVLSRLTVYILQPCLICPDNSESLQDPSAHRQFEGRGSQSIFFSLNNLSQQIYIFTDFCLIAVLMGLQIIPNLLLQ